MRPRLLTMSFTPDEHGPSLARRFVAHALTLVGLEEEEPDAALVVSELVANACRFAQDEVVVRVHPAGKDGLRLEIEDDGPGMPRLEEPDDDGSGHGLHIVATIARRWGTEPTGGGKVVWAEIGARGMQRVSA